MQLSPKKLRSDKIVTHTHAQVVHEDPFLVIEGDSISRQDEDVLGTRHRPNDNADPLIVEDINEVDKAAHRGQVADGHLGDAGDNQSVVLLCYRMVVGCGEGLK